ncbi:uncharacterized protein HMPREF1541_01942 [Cyphellophora europaea CBS 101466]|uniref:GH64 domain-containing protein n=1 Tax=Cyphellophora europaea (strain CBS 101466) TaxID=1220924 RepID=W2S489_CYPE1|nr:uncharacterized protein HMPREF1541_01942 [Cyphellophora europaea CBS 101466]ETN42784.1 hypothetical protein HMPREF1541_01942 [Cyphellophora europaea CBS 101466]
MRRFRSIFEKKRPDGQQPLQQHQQPPASDGSQSPAAPPPTGDDNFAVQAVSGTLSIALVNQFAAGTTVYATVSGRAIDNNNALFLLGADGRTPYYPPSPGSTMSPVSQNTAIRLGGTGSTTNLTVPHIAGGRIYFSLGQPLKFFINPGPALVEPSVSNPSDPNVNLDWGFCEFTFNSDQLYANISYVDFVSDIPVALTLTTINSGTRTVRGLKPNGLNNIASALRAQHAADGKPWDQLIVTHQNRNLRVLSPNLGRVGNNSLFNGYFEPYVDQVWSRFATQPMHIDTQAQWGVVSATTTHNGTALSFTTQRSPSDGGQQKPITSPSVFTKPSTADIFSCSTGPFATGANALTNAIIPRLSAAFNRSTLLKTDAFPASQSLFYQEAVTNHYSRVVHENNYDGKGYAFPYDDVQPSGGADQSGEVHAGDPKVWTVTVGGG